VIGKKARKAKEKERVCEKGINIVKGGREKNNEENEKYREREGWRENEK
jgi:hypothetical protein